MFPEKSNRNIQREYRKTDEGSLRRILDVKKENWHLGRRYGSVPNELHKQKRHIETVFDDCWKVITESDNVAVLHKLVDDNQRVVKQTNDKGNNLIHHSVLHGRIQCLHYLISAGCNMNQTDIYKETPLIWAVRYSPSQARMECVAILVKRGANLDKGAPTPLWIAVNSNDFPIVQFLVGSGSDTDVSFPFSEKRLTPKLLAKEKGYTNIEAFLEFTECARGIEKGNDNVVKSLISLKPHLLKEKDQNGNTLLHLASSFGRESLMEPLLPGSEENAVNNMGRTPLFLCAANGHLGCVQKLAGCSEVDLEKKDNDGVSPLRMAVSKNFTEVSSLLLSFGVTSEGNEHEPPPRNRSHWCRHHKLPLSLVEK